MTTYPTSTAPAAKAWLYGQMVTLLTADADYTFQVSYAPQDTTMNTPDDMVWLGDVVNRQPQGFAMVGNQGQYSTAEEYDLTGTISVARFGENDPGDVVAVDPAALAEARAWALLGVIETAQRTDPTMGGVVITSRPNESTSNVDWDEPGNARVCTLPFSFHCKAVI